MANATLLSRALLQLPFESFYSDTRLMDANFPSSIAILIVEMILLGIALLQLLRFYRLPNAYIKKVIHALIACQLVASIVQVMDMSAFIRIEFKPFILFSIQETAFVFSALAYLTVLLFWIDFNSKLRTPGPGIRFLQTKIFGLMIFTFAFGYIALVVVLNYVYASTKEQGWKLSFKFIWWHLLFYCIITPMQLYYAYGIHRAMNQLYFTCSHSLVKTKKILHAVNFCFVMRTISIITFVALYYKHTHAEELYLCTWPAFICFYILDQVLPAALFMFLLRKSPKQHAALINKTPQSTYGSFASQQAVPGTCNQ